MVDDLFTMSKTANYWYKDGYNPARSLRRWWARVLAMAPVLLGGIVFGMAGASQYSWFIGCGVAFGLYYVLATRGPWKMSRRSPRVSEAAGNRLTRHALRPDIPQVECRAVRFAREPSLSPHSAFSPSTPAAVMTCCAGSRSRWPTCGPPPRVSSTASSTSWPPTG